MKYAWLEKMAADGQIRQEALEHIYAECTSILENDKTANAAVGVAEGVLGAAGKVKGALSMLPSLVAALYMGTLIGQPIYRGIRQKIVDSQTRAAIDMNRQRVASVYTGEDKAKAEARFNEIAKFAPHVAINEAVTRELVRRKYRTGFTDTDIQNLMQIETRLNPDPMGYAAMSDYQLKTSSRREEVLVELGEKLATAATILEHPEKFTHLPFFTPEVVEGFQMMKTASPPPIDTKALLAYLAIPTAIGAGATLVGLGKQFLDNRSLQKKIDASYGAMLEGPNGEFFQNNPTASREAFSSLTHFAPHVAIEPLAAGSFVKKMLQFKGDPQLQAPDVKTLTDIESNFGNRQGGYWGAIAKGIESSGWVPAAYSGLDARFLRS